MGKVLPAVTVVEPRALEILGGSGVETVAPRGWHLAHRSLLQVPDEGETEADEGQEAHLGSLLHGAGDPGSSNREAVCVLLT
jgi:hypothetical protein